MKVKDMRKVLDGLPDDALLEMTFANACDLPVLEGGEPGPKASFVKEENGLGGFWALFVPILMRDNKCIDPA